VIEEALQVRIEGLGASEWGRRLDDLMAAVAADLQIEFQGLPPASITFSNRANVIRTRQGLECWRACGACWGLTTGRVDSQWASERCRTGVRRENVRPTGEGAVLLQPGPVKS
jgi:hypothetical protein